MIAATQSAAACVVAFACVAGCGAGANAVDPWRDLPAQTSAGLSVVVEIPAGTNDKWEYEAHSGELTWELRDGVPRVVDFLPYPGNYGFVPQTLQSSADGGDGDPLDVFVLGPAVARGEVVSVRLIGVVRLLDDGEIDDKLIAVFPTGPLSRCDDLPCFRASYPGALEALSAWLGGYDARDETVIRSIDDAAAARAALAAGMAAFDAAHSP